LEIGGRAGESVLVRRARALVPARFEHEQEPEHEYEWIRNLSFLVHALRVVVIRRLTDRHRAYTGIFLRGEPPQIFPTSDAEHARILQIYKQDRPYAGIVNDFSEYALGSDRPLPGGRRQTTDDGQLTAEGGSSS
jgi:hypothetical protein